MQENQQRGWGMEAQEFFRRVASEKFLKKRFEDSQAKRSVYKHGNVRSSAMSVLVVTRGEMVKRAH
jgi:hypothetical protein